MDRPADDVPTLSPATLALRLGLEIGAFTGLGVGGWSVGRWIGVVVAPLVGIVLWGTFNVPDDPSRSGRAPVPVAGPVRLAGELAGRAAGFAGWALGGLWPVTVVLGALAALHYATSTARVRWLLRS